LQFADYNLAPWGNTFVADFTYKNGPPKSGAAHSTVARREKVYLPQHPSRAPLAYVLPLTPLKIEARGTILTILMDAIELLKQDHQKVKQLFDRGTATEDRKQQKQIFKEIKSAVEEEDEEEGKMFPEIRDLIEHTKLEQLGEELESVKHKRLRKAG
jgi:hypothetical protein